MYICKIRSCHPLSMVQGRRLKIKDMFPNSVFEVNKTDRADDNCLPNCNHIRISMILTIIYYHTRVRTGETKIYHTPTMSDV